MTFVYQQAARRAYVVRYPVYWRRNDRKVNYVRNTDPSVNITVVIH